MRKEAMCAATAKSEEIYQLLKNFEFWKVLQIIPWIYRFLENCKCKEKLSGPVEAKEAKKKKKQNYLGQDMDKEKLQQQTTL